MTPTEESLAGLKTINPDVKVLSDGGRDYVFLPRQAILVGDVRHEMDALLCPGEHTGYATRLFLAQPIAERPTIRGQPANWTPHTILGRTWHSWSWRDVSATLPLSQMLLAHVSALR